tara:strand:- start:378 stop:593 length:216 start_codon:yes stop_codon:yes gene_type:complete
VELVAADTTIPAAFVARTTVEQFRESIALALKLDVNRPNPCIAADAAAKTLQTTELGQLKGSFSNYKRGKY